MAKYAEALVREELAKVIREEDIEQWLRQPNRMLESETPMHLIENGNADKVLSLIDALAEGVSF